jgi:hypothetical protein
VAFEPFKANPVAWVSAKLRIAPIKYMTPFVRSRKKVQNFRIIQEFE